MDPFELYAYLNYYYGDDKMKSFTSFLSAAGHDCKIALNDIFKYEPTVAAIVTAADPALAPEVTAFQVSFTLVQGLVASAEMKWGADPGTNPQKLADVLAQAELPVITLFQQAGVKVDATYVTNLVNAALALLKVKPAVGAPAAPAPAIKPSNTGTVTA